MKLLSKVNKRTLHPGIEIVNEVVKPVAEKWVDEKIHQTDNLQLTLQNVGKKPLSDVWVYLKYFASDGKELGHEMEIGREPFRPGEETRVSILLTPPPAYSHCEIEVIAEKYKVERQLWVNSLLVIGAVAVIVLANFRQ